MSITMEVRVEQLSPSSFRPFGQIIGRFDGTPSYATSSSKAWRLEYDVKGSTDLLFFHYEHGPLECDSIERHFHVTQSFIPLANAASIMMVAPPTDRSTMPRPEAVRAFYVPGAIGIMLWRGTWHAPTRFPLQLSGAAFVLLTDRETQRELERVQSDGTPPILTESVNMCKLYNTKFKMTDPDHLLRSEDH
jgi:ureidoglycolate lyase